MEVLKELGDLFFYIQISITLLPVYLVFQLLQWMGRELYVNNWNDSKIVIGEQWLEAADNIHFNGELNQNERSQQNSEWETSEPR